MKYHCGFCRKEGHNSRTCPYAKAQQPLDEPQHTPWVGTANHSVIVDPNRV